MGLNDPDNWSQRLSSGEQQRLAFVRVLLTRPQVLCLDEATSALNPDTEALLYELVLQEIKDAVIVSIAHRGAVAKYHHLRWQFVHESAHDEWLAGARQLPCYTIQSSKLSDQQ